MKKVLVFSRDPGAVNVVIPIYKKLSTIESIQVDLYGKDTALIRYREQGFVGIDIATVASTLSVDILVNFLVNSKYDLIVTGTTSDDVTDVMLWEAAFQAGIRSVAILDQWMNYTYRFTYERLRFPGKDVRLILPDIVCVMDDYARNEMLLEGFPEERLVVTGQPYFETVQAEAGMLSTQEKESLLSGLGIEEDEIVVTFASEAIAESVDTARHLGYTQLSILEVLIPVLEKLSCGQCRAIVLVIKLHPRNDLELFAKYHAYKGNIKIVLAQEVSSRVLIGISTVIVGMSSMFLLEAVCAKRPIVSVQVGLVSENPFILARRGLVTTVVDKESLEAVLLDIIVTGKQGKLPSIKFIDNASETIMGDVIMKFLSEPNKKV